MIEIKLPDHPSLAGLSYRARLLACTLSTLETIGIRDIDHVKLACMSNGMTEEDINLARRELVKAKATQVPTCDDALTRFRLTERAIQLSKKAETMTDITKEMGLGDLADMMEGFEIFQGIQKPPEPPQ